MKKLLTIAAMTVLAACATSGTRLDGSACNNQYDCGESDWFASRVTVEDDRMESFIRYHTNNSRMPYYPESILGGIKHDFYFDVRVDRKTGAHVVFVRGFLQNDRDWAEPSNIYLPEINRYLDLERGSFDVDCSRSSCTHLENFYGELSPSFISAFLSFYSDEYATAEVRFNSRVDVDRTIRASELRAVLEAAGITSNY